MLGRGKQAGSIPLAIKGCLRGREGDRMDTADIEHEAQKASDGLTTNALIPAAATATKWVENNVALFRAVLNGVGD